MSNAVQQQVDRMLHQWEQAISQDGVKLIRLMVKTEDISMLDAFYQYMLGIDTDQQDITFLLELPFSSRETFSKEILTQIDTTIEEWNTATFPEDLPFRRIEWRADYTETRDSNEAHLAVSNMNAFVKSLCPEGAPKISFIFKLLGVYDEADFNKWLEQALQLPFDKAMVWGIADYVGFDTMKEIANRYEKEVESIYPDINLARAAEQISEQLAQEASEENAPDANFRMHLIKLMRATNDKNRAEIDKQTKLCIEIILGRVQHDPNWIAQLVVVYTLLYSYHIGIQELDNALFFADKAIETACLSEGKIDTASSFKLQGNAYILKGNVLILKEELRIGAEVYQQGAETYKKGGEFRLCCECLRVAADCWHKLGETDKELDSYVKAFELVDKFSAEDIWGSTYPLLLLGLYQHPERHRAISTKQIEQALLPLLGEDWLALLHSYKHNLGHYEQYSDLV